MWVQQLGIRNQEVIHMCLCLWHLEKPRIIAFSEVGKQPVLTRISYLKACILVLKDTKHNSKQILAHVWHSTSRWVSYLQACVLEELKQVPQPTQSRAGYLKAHALEQLKTQLQTLKHVKKTKTAAQEHQIQDFHITHNARTQVSTTTIKKWRK